MSLPKFLPCLLLAGLFSAPFAFDAHVLKAQTISIDQNGQHDFDFEVGTWRTHLKRLLHPLAGSSQWVECEGTTVVRKV